MQKVTNSQNCTLYKQTLLHLGPEITNFPSQEKVQPEMLQGLSAFAVPKTEINVYKMGENSSREFRAAP